MLSSLHLPAPDCIRPQSLHDEGGKTCDMQYRGRPIPTGWRAVRIASDLSKLDLLIMQIDGLHLRNDLVLIAEARLLRTLPAGSTRRRQALPPAFLKVSTRC